MNPEQETPCMRCNAVTSEERGGRKLRGGGMACRSCAIAISAVIGGADPRVARGTARDRGLRGSDPRVQRPE